MTEFDDVARVGVTNNVSDTSVTPPALAASPMVSRRGLIGGAAGLAAGIAGLTPEIAEAGPRERSLAIYNPRTREAVDVIYRIGNRYSRNNLRKINHIMRDWRSGDEVNIDPAVIDYLYSVKRWLGVRKPIHMISGYRSPATNARLAQQRRGVARNSYHTKGMAMDIRIPGYSVRSIARAAEALKIGGVGRYSRSNFVHLDSADVRTWGR